MSLDIARCGAATFAGAGLTLLSSLPSLAHLHLPSTYATSDLLSLAVLLGSQRVSRSLRHLALPAAAAALPRELVLALAGLRGLRSLELSHAGVAAPETGHLSLLTCLTSFRLVVSSSDQVRVWLGGRAAGQVACGGVRCAFD